MIARHLKSPLVAVALALAAGTANCYASDAIEGSFQRMLSHEPASAAVAALAAPADPLIEAMVVPLRDGFRTPLYAVDPVAGGFARMLAHTPNPVSPPVPAGAGVDPLVAAMIEPMRRSFAEGEAPTHYAVVRTQRTAD